MTLLNHIASRHRAALWYVILIIMLPVAGLALIGLFSLWQQGLLLTASLSWMAATLVATALYSLYTKKRTQHSPKDNAQVTATAAEDTASFPAGDSNSAATALPNTLKARPDWTDQDRHIWQQVLVDIPAIAHQSSSWEALPQQAVNVLTRIQQYYKGNTQNLADIAASLDNTDSAAQAHTFSFTIPELLLVVAEASSRYRTLLIAHLPFADRIKVSSLITLHRHKDQLADGARWLNTVRRTARLINPVAALSAEIREYFSSRLFSEFSTRVQEDLRQLFLQEVAQVAMDLYSGRLSTSQQELSDYQSLSHQQDLRALATPTEPLRVVIIGQISAGKSSLINTLVQAIKAEVDVLPGTIQVQAHAFSPETDDNLSTEASATESAIHLIDTPGIEDGETDLAFWLDQVQQADLIIWVARATQPARAPDAQLMQAISALTIQHPERRPAPVMLVVTHIDQLPPRRQWQPPYDLTEQDGKAHNIQRAVTSCREQIGLPEETPAIPVSLSAEHAAYNTEAVVAQIMLMEQQASQAQLNRKRVEYNNQRGSWRERWQQALRLGAVTGRVLVRSVSRPEP